MQHISTSAMSDATIKNAKRKLKRTQALRYFYRVKIKSHLFKPAKYLYSLTSPSMAKNTLTYEDPDKGITTLLLTPNMTISITIPECEGTRDQILHDYFQYAKFV